MTVRVGLNGFGRIGRSIFRILHQRDDVDVVAINDLFDNDQLAYLLKYDTVMGVFPDDVRVEGDAIWAGEKRVEMTAIPDPAEIPWKRFEVDAVIECTGVFRHRAPLEKHLQAGAPKVILTVPAKDEIDATIVLGVNDDRLEPGHRIISNASCTTNCLAPIAKILHSSFGIEEGFITTVHAYTNDQRLADVPHKNLRRSRAAAENVIPTTTGAARAVGKVMPELDGKLDGMALRVPVPDGSIVDLVCKVGKKVDRDGVNAAVREAALGELSQVVEYSDEPLVSTDIVGNPHSAIFDALSTTAEGDGYVKVVAWYDNEWGYSNRVVDLLDRAAALG